MDKTFRNTEFDNLVNYSCYSNSAATPQIIEDSSDERSLASLIKNDQLVQIRELKEDKILIKMAIENTTK